MLGVARFVFLTFLLIVLHWVDGLIDSVVSVPVLYMVSILSSVNIVELK